MAGMQSNQSNTTTSVLCVAPFNNPHIVPTYDALTKCDGVDVVRVCLRRLRSHRIAMGWQEMSEDSPYLQPWRRRRDRRSYWRALLKSDVVIFPGFQMLPFHHWYRRLSGKTTLMWSEPFIGHHHRPMWRYWATSLLKSVVNTPRVHLLAMGGQEAAEDVLAVGGASQWRFWNFAFAVQPVHSLDKNFEALLGREIRIVYSGSLVERKRVDVLIRALGKPELRALRWRLDVLGDGPLRAEVSSLAASLGIDGRIQIRGFLPIEQARQCMAESDILVLPSRFDGWGAVVNEAMEYGMAVVCSDTVGAKMLVTQGVNGFVFKNGSDEDLARRLASMLADPRGLVEMCRASRSRIEQFRPEAAAKRLAALCRGLAGHGPVPGYETGLCAEIVPNRYKLKHLLKTRANSEAQMTPDAV